MKNILLCIVIMLAGILASSQQTRPGQQFTKEDYLKKSTNQKTAGWILLGGGAALTIGGAIWWGQEFSLFGETTGAEAAAGIITVTGIAAMAGSIPLFIASGRNKRKAMDMAINLKMEKVVSCQHTRLDYNYYPALTLSVRIK
ncbi:MAG: hypothetical protein JNK14_08710 [Chitinophagaceae bacterium]|nr:hypothetical protein [Chitinophagaceae bacterium]